MRDSQGTIYRFVGIAEDITERKRLEEQFRQAQKMEAVGRLAGGVAHDFNNLLTVIASCTDFVLSDPTLGEEHRDDLTEVKKATDRATALTRQMVAFGRTQVLRPATINMNDRLTELLGRAGEVLPQCFDLVGSHAPTIPLAAAFFQSLAVQDGDVSPRIADQAGLLQLDSAFRHALAAHAKHVGNQLLRHHEFVALQAVKAEQ